MKVTGVLALANGRAELVVDGETFAAPARYAGRRVTIEVEDFLPPVVRRLPADVFGAVQAPAAGGGGTPSAPTGPSTQPAGGMSGRDPVQRVVTPEDLEVLG